jgi:hypothetical protein
MSFDKIRRNPHRIRQKQSRPRVKPFSSMTPQGEAVWAMKEGLDKKTAKPMKP